jgi:hypothetical protein
VARTTNGYWYAAQGASTFRTLTLIKQGIKIASPMVRLISDAMPFGFGRKKELLVKGIEPAKLGAETLRK